MIGGITGRWKGPVAATIFSASSLPSDVSISKPRAALFRLTDFTSTPHRMGASICFAYCSKYRVTLSFEANPSAATSLNSRLGKRSCQAGPFALRESHLSLRHRSAIRLFSSTRCGSPQRLKCSLIAMPACPPPTISVPVFSTDMNAPCFLIPA